MPESVSVLAPDQAERLATVSRYHILDTSPELSFDRITVLAARSLQVPIALVSIVDDDRIWFKSQYGVSLPEMPRHLGLGPIAMEQDEVFTIPDLALDLNTANHPWIQTYGMRCYAAAPLRTEAGVCLGMLCVLDRQPRQFTAAEKAILQDLAAIVIDEWERRCTLQQNAQLHQQVQTLHTMLENQVQERTHQLQQSLDFESTLKRITDKVRDSFDEHQILQSAVEELASVLKVSCCNAALYDLEQQTSMIRYEHATSVPSSWGRISQMANAPELYTQLLQGQYFQFCSILPNPVRGRVAMLACPILLGAGATVPALPEATNLHQPETSVIGDLWLINPAENAFSDLAIRLVQQVANQCAIALRQARLYQAAQAQVAELEKLNRLKDTFLSTVSHELRTPISNMKMAIYMLRNLPNSDRRDHYLDILQAECVREIELINDLLDLQQLESGVYSNLLGVVNLPEWLMELVEPFCERAKQWQHLLQIELAPSLPLVISDRISLSRILSELLKNASKYTPVGGQIFLSIAYTMATAELTFCVRNQAEIPQSELPRIFEKFYRIPHSDPWRRGGTGLGLALVQQLVQQLEGTIQATSEAGWTTITVQLPAPIASGDSLERAQSMAFPRRA